MQLTTQLELDNLARTVIEVEPAIKDYLEVAVILEVLGYSDEWAMKRGYGNLFSIAKKVYEAVNHFRYEEPHRTRFKQKKVNNIPSLFFSGLFYNIGWILILTALLLSGVGLWSAIDIPVQFSTSISLGVIIAFILTGGIQQFFAWKVIYYRLQNNYPLVRFEIKNALLIGVFLLALASFILTFILGPLPFFSNVNLNLTTTYLFLIGLYRLSMIPTYAYRKISSLLTATLAALLALFVTYYYLISNGVPRLSATVSSQVVALSAAIIVGSVFMIKLAYGDHNLGPSNGEAPPFYFRSIPPRKVTPPKLSVQFFDGWEYLLYGFMYFAFMFSDRIISWFTNGAVAYNVSYHMGADLALLIIIPLSGAKLVYIARLTNRIQTRLENTRIRTLKKEFSNEIKRFYRSLSVTVILTALIAGMIMLIFGSKLLYSADAPQESLEVFKWALVANAFFGIYIMNSVFSFSLRKGKGVALILAFGTALAFTASYILSKIYLQWYSVFGYLLAAILMSVFSSFYVRRLIKDAIYVYFSAF